MQRQFLTYRHYKGGVYVKLCEAVHSETEEVMVVYACAVGGLVFCRPKAMFEEEVRDGDYVGPRFVPFPAETTRDERKQLVWEGRA